MTDDAGFVTAMRFVVSPTPVLTPVEGSTRRSSYPPSGAVTRLTLT